MVCKEDVLTWFKDLDSYKRIDLMFELLNMCLPFEIRFLGTCIEEIGKHSYQELRGPAILANDVEKLSKDTSLMSGLLDESTRHRTLIYISLLSARNCSCANWFYNTLLRTDWLEEQIVKGKCKDENLQSELLLLFTMALYHSAFAFEHKTYFGKMLLHLINQTEGKQVASVTSNYCYPPGFGYPSTHAAHSDVPIIPVKTASPVCMGDTPAVIQKFHPPVIANYPAMPQSMDLMQPIWSRAAFPATVCGVPEVAPFPPPPAVSPLVSRAASPHSSRATSPQRTFSIGPQTSINMAQMGPPLDAVPHPQMHLETLSQSSSLPPYSSIVKPSEDEINHITDDKIRENPWVGSILYEMKPPNGIRLPFYKYQQPFLQEQMHGLNLEGEKSLHCSSSSSSCGSPVGTPCGTPAVTPHGPGRGETKTRVNGISHVLSNAPPGPPLCDQTPPPPPPPPFSHCTVPYSNYPHVTLTAIPNRSMFQYTQSRYPLPFPYPPNDNVYPYVPVVYSSVPSAPRNLNCYNCGANGHIGAECSGQTIEDITQKAYTLEYNLPDMDKL